MIMQALRNRIARLRTDGLRTDGRREAGFTLVELLGVLAILGLLGAVATPQVLKYLGKAKVDTAQIEIKSLSTALDLYMIDVRRYPTQPEGLTALAANSCTVPRWLGTCI